MSHPLYLYEPILTREESRAADEYTIKTLGKDSLDLMEQAGDAVFRAAIAAFTAQDSPFVIPFAVFCGPGNNGGDGFSCARRLLEAGYQTLVFCLTDPNDLKGDARGAFLKYVHHAKHQKQASAQECWRTIDDIVALEKQLHETQPVILIDALFGTGLSRPLIGKQAAVIEAINRWRSAHAQSCKVLAVDIPSGLSANGDILRGPAIKADTTITFFTRKIAHVSEPNCFFCGDVICRDIGVLAPPAEHRNFRAFALLKSRQPALPLLKTIEPSDYKGSFAHVGVFEGSLETRGASRLAARAALRAGAGLITLLVNDLTLGAPYDAAEFMKRSARVANRRLIDKVTVMVIGPGLIDQKSRKKALAILKLALLSNISIVLDAGGLALLFQLGKIQKSDATVIATPHPGEAAQLLGESAQVVQNDRLRAIQRLHQLSADLPFRIIWVLKGACPMIAEKDGSMIICEGGVSTLAAGGSGDVLSGLIAGLCGRTLDLFDGVVVAVSAHLAAGRRLENLSTRGHLASEIADALPLVLYPPKN